MSDLLEASDEIKEISLKLPFSVESFVKALNEARFGIQVIFREITQLLIKLLDTGSTIVKLPKLKQNIDLRSQEIIHKLIQFFSDSSTVSSFLPEFFYHDKISHYIMEKYGRDIKQAENQSDLMEIIDSLKVEIPSKQITVYKFKPIECQNIQELIIFIVISELMIDFDKNNTEFSTQNLGSSNEEQIGIVDVGKLKSFDTINVEEEIKKKVQDSERNMNNKNKETNFEVKNVETSENEVIEHSINQIGSINSLDDEVDNSTKKEEYLKIEEKNPIGRLHSENDAILDSPVISSKTLQKKTPKNDLMMVEKYPKNLSKGQVSLLNKVFASCLIVACKGDKKLTKMSSTEQNNLAYKSPHLKNIRVKQNLFTDEFNEQKQGFIMILLSTPLEILSDKMQDKLLMSKEEINSDYEYIPDIEYEIESIKILFNELVASTRRLDHSVGREELRNFMKKHDIPFENLVIDEILSMSNMAKYSYLTDNLIKNHLFDPLSYKDILKIFRKQSFFNQEINQFDKRFIKHYDLWCQMMEVIGQDKIPIYLNSPVEYFTRKNNTQFNSSGQVINPNTPNLNLIKSVRSNKKLTKVRKLPLIRFPKRFKPEAGIMVITTPNILAKKPMKFNIDVEENPIEKTLNLNFHKPLKGIGYERISFKTQKFHEEAMKISKDPKSILKSDIHPIYRFIPSNYTDLTEHEKNKKLDEEKLNMMVASNLTFVSVSNNQSL